MSALNELAALRHLRALSLPMLDGLDEWFGPLTEEDSAIKISYFNVLASLPKWVKVLLIKEGQFMFRWRATTGEPGHEVHSWNVKRRDIDWRWSQDLACEYRGLPPNGRRA